MEFRLRVCVWLVALAGTKLAKKNEPKENPQDFPSNHCTSNELYTLLCFRYFFFSISLFMRVIIYSILLFTPTDCKLVYSVFVYDNAI